MFFFFLGHLFAHVDEKFYFFGGKKDNILNDKVFIFDFHNKNWKIIQPNLKEISLLDRMNHALSFGKQIYVWGQSQKDPFNGVFIFDTQSESWIKKESSHKENNVDLK